MLKNKGFELNKIHFKKIKGYNNRGILIKNSNFAKAIKKIYYYVNHPF